MKGIELSKAFYAQYGKPMLEEDFTDILPFLAVGLFGSGSECFGFDDAVSADHDFEPGSCIFLPGEDVVDRKRAFALERAYAKLPKEFMGYRRAMLSPVGGARHGVMRTAEFFEEKIGAADGVLTLSQWFAVPEQALAECTNGEIFFDNYGEVTRVREALCAFPEEIRLKKLAGNLLIMAQAGQYNYPRCVQRGDRGAAFFAMNEFVQAALSAVFLLNRKYMPFYKWAFRAAGELTILQDSVRRLRRLADLEQVVPPAEAQSLIEGICAEVAEELRRQDFSSSEDSFLAPHSGEIMAGIQDPEIRRLHVMADCD